MKPFSRYFPVDTVLIAIIGVCGLVIARNPLTDPDLGWHLISGLWFLENTSVPRHDVIGVSETPWVSYSWLFDVVIAQVYQLAFFSSLHFARYALAAGCILSVLYLIRSCSHGRERSSPIQAQLFECLTLAVLLVLISPYWKLRPQVLSYVFFSLLLSLAERRKLQPKYLVVLTIAWANIHLYWLLVPAVVFLDALSDAERLWKDRAVRACVLGIFYVALGLVNPYGVGLFEAMYASLFGIGDFYGFVAELKPLEMVDNLRRLPVIFILIGAAVCFRRIARGEKLTLTALFLILAWQAVKHAKYIPLFGIIAIPFLVRHIFPLLSRFFESVRKGGEMSRTVESKLPRERKDYAVLAVIFVLLTSWFVWHDPSVKLSFGRSYFVVKKLAQTDFYDDTQRVVVFSDYGLSGWLALHFWNTRREGERESRFRIAIDGRNVVHGNARLSDYRKIKNLELDWKKILNRWQVRVIIAQTKHSRTNYLINELANENWRVFEQGELFTALVR